MNNCPLSKKIQKMQVSDLNKRVNISRSNSYDRLFTSFVEDLNQSLKSSLNISNSNLPSIQNRDLSFNNKQVRLKKQIPRSEHQVLTTEPVNLLKVQKNPNKFFKIAPLAKEKTLLENAKIKLPKPTSSIIPPKTNNNISTYQNLSQISSSDVSKAIFKRLESITKENFSVSAVKDIINGQGQISQYSIIWTNFIETFQEYFKKQINEITLDFRRELKRLQQKNKEIKTELNDKINNLNTKLEGNEKYISELEGIINNLHMKLNSNSSSSSQEYNLYKNKELLRDYKTIIEENTQLRLDYNHLVQNSNKMSDDVSKMKNLLVILTQNGIPVDEIFLSSSPFLGEKEPKLIPKKKNFTNALDIVETLCKPDIKKKITQDIDEETNREIPIFVEMKVNDLLEHINVSPINSKKDLFSKKSSAKDMFSTGMSDFNADTFLLDPEQKESNKEKDASNNRLNQNSAKSKASGTLIQDKPIVRNYFKSCIDRENNVQTEKTRTKRVILKEKVNTEPKRGEKKLSTKKTVQEDDDSIFK